MIIVGEKLNSSIPHTSQAIAQRDRAYVINLARKQLEGGADWLDVNAAVFMEGERDALLWMIDAVQRETGAKLMIDSPNAGVIAAALAADTAGNAIINSVTLDEAKLAALLPLAKQYGAGVVALPISTAGLPKTAQARLDNVNCLMDRMAAGGISPSQIYMDPLVETLSSRSTAASVTLETIHLIHAAHPNVNILCGLSNISFGLPRRRLINSVFLTAILLAGANAVILDATDSALAETIAAAEALGGQDDFCLNYLKFCRENRLHSNSNS